MEVKNIKKIKEEEKKEVRGENKINKNYKEKKIDIEEDDDIKENNKKMDKEKEGEEEEDDEEIEEEDEEIEEEGEEIEEEDEEIEEEEEEDKEGKNKLVCPSCHEKIEKEKIFRHIGLNHNNIKEKNFIFKILIKSITKKANKIIENTKVNYTKLKTFKELKKNKRKKNNWENILDENIKKFEQIFNKN